MRIIQAIGSPPDEESERDSIIDWDEPWLGDQDHDESDNWSPDDER